MHIAAAGLGLKSCYLFACTGLTVCLLIVTRYQSSAQKWLPQLQAVCSLKASNKYCRIEQQAAYLLLLLLVFHLHKFAQGDLQGPLCSLQ